jgi:hypothetical protein
MDPIRNPFAPGAGTQPPQLAGRDQIIEDARIAVHRAIAGRSSRSQILLGLRGVGKTVLLNKIEQEAEAAGHVTSFIEAPEDRKLADLLYPRLQHALQSLSRIEKAKASAYTALRALRSFAGAFKVRYGDYGIELDPEPGVADSGNLEYDLTDLFLRVGETAKAAGKGWTLLIDEVQYLDQTELAALIVALHKCNQRALPVLFFGAGLPQVAALSGEAKSYAERLFSYPNIGPLDDASARAAIRRPVEAEGESISDAALTAVNAATGRYPYYLQEWGFHAWNIADQSPIDEADVSQATVQALRRLDEGFFKVRFDRLTPKERDYVIAMASLGAGPYRSSDVAEALGAKVTSLGPLRAKIIEKGMIYSPAHGDIAFTVPMFEDYLKRNWMPQP